MKLTDAGGIWTTMEHLYKFHGVRGFWRSNVLNVLKSMPEFAIKFSMYDYVKCELKAFRGDDGLLNVSDRFLAGAVAGVCSQTLLYPLEARKLVVYG